MLKYALLGFINYGVTTGYDIFKAMEKSTAYFWHAKQSQIYTTLKAMEKQGLVQSRLDPGDGTPDRRVYSITDAGRAEMKAWLEKPVTELPVYKDQLLLKLFFSGDIEKELILTQLRQARSLHTERLKVYADHIKTHIEEAAAMLTDRGRDAVLWDATRLMGEMYEDTAIRWLDQIIAMVEDKF